MSIDENTNLTKTVTIPIEEYKGLIERKSFINPKKVAREKTPWEELDEEVQEFFTSPTGRMHLKCLNAIVTGLSCTSLYKTWRTMVTLHSGSYTRWYTNQDVDTAREIFEEMKVCIR